MIYLQFYPMERMFRPLESMFQPLEFTFHCMEEESLLSFFYRIFVCSFNTSEIIKHGNRTTTAGKSRY